jgi:hypothetical protein
MRAKFKALAITNFAATPAATLCFLIFVQLEKHGVIHPPLWLVAAIAVAFLVVLTSVYADQIVTISGAWIKEARRPVLPFIRRRPRKVRWSEIKGYSYDPIIQHLTIETDRKPIHIARLFFSKGSLDEFARVFLNEIADQRRRGRTSAEESGVVQRESVRPRAMAYFVSGALLIALGLYLLGEAQLAGGVILGLLVAMGMSFTATKPTAYWRYAVLLAAFVAITLWLIWANELTLLPVVIVVFVLWLAVQIPVISRIARIDRESRAQGR